MVLGLRACYPTAVDDRSAVGFSPVSLVSTATTSLQLPDFLPLTPGVLALICIGAAHPHTPIYFAGRVLDRRTVRKASGVWTPS